MAYYGMSNPMDNKYSISIVPNAIIKLSLIECELGRDGLKIEDSWDKHELDLIKAFCREQDGGCSEDDVWLIQVEYHSDDPTLCDKDGKCDDHPFPRYIPLWMVSGKTQGSEILFELDSDNDIAVRLTCDQTKCWSFNPEKYGLKTSENPDPQEYDPAWEQDPFQTEVMNAILRRIENGGFYNIDMKIVNDKFHKDMKLRHQKMAEMFNQSK